MHIIDFAGENVSLCHVSSYCALFHVIHIKVNIFIRMNRDAYREIEFTFRCVFGCHTILITVHWAVLCCWFDIESTAFLRWGTFHPEWWFGTDIGPSLNYNKYTRVLSWKTPVAVPIWAHHSSDKGQCPVFAVIDYIAQQTKYVESVSV